MADPVVLTVLHDLAEALVGDITPKDKVGLLLVLKSFSLSNI